jgi:hypothetical protein
MARQMRSKFASLAVFGLKLTFSAMALCGQCDGGKRFSL